MKEWRILERDLPESIFVRVYENRIDLLRAVIVGAAGTPYHDGLFFFDIAFPSDYPARPPLVYYHSFGLRLNPNLYENGRVCLSLINTWGGKKCERWNPNESTILQVLLSIQALVLNEKPYYNEPGYTMWPGRALRQRQSMVYNENAFYLSCQTMLILLRLPPRNFDGFVNWHFRVRSQAILSACQAYSSGKVTVGSYTSDGSGSSTVDEDVVSRLFKGLLGGLYPELVAAFSSTGASVEHFVEQPKLELEAASYKADGEPAKKKENKEKRGFSISKILGKLKKVFGMKNRVKHLCSSSST
ncbi:putative ubiquitin-conjugating enzyme E2 38 [Carica papaya]|uniref:putative ubiquitin-conjugating enzyme E2 38 n=1 Tax=Carica papaya TaxID=3649 RepID=UPI000B8C77CE|nr:putative ubiquitin-conjugating enzyme E2 38 [Carica papaya]